MNILTAILCNNCLTGIMKGEWRELRCERSDKKPRTFNLFIQCCIGTILQRLGIN